MPRVKDTIPKELRPYISLGVDLEWDDREAHGDCPFCGATGKFFVKVDTSEYQCKVCAEGNDRGGGNSTLFVQRLHAMLHPAQDDLYAELAGDRGLLNGDTLRQWGLVFSPLTHEWLFPAYSAAGSLLNLFRYTDDATAQKRVLRSTSGLNVQVFGVPLLRKEHSEVWVVESWNAPILWETLKAAGVKDTGVLGVPGCNVWQESWGKLVAGRRVIFAFDSDREKTNRTTGKAVRPAGLVGTERASLMLSVSASPPESISYLKWGPGGFDPEQKDGWDIRDALSASPNPVMRAKALENLRARVEAVPDEWRAGAAGRNAVVGEGKELKPVECSKWRDVVNAWKGALRWRQEIEDALAVMLAVAASTSQVGDQLFLMVLADPGSAKSRLCDAMLVSKRCFALEHLTGFHSGWKGEGGEDCSLISRINHLTLITPEGDVVMSSPHFDEIMSQQRRIFDGSSGATYKNSSEDKRHTGLRTPWIIAGTLALLDKNQARLGDRFIRVRIDPPDHDEKRAILRSVGFSALRSVVQTSNGDATTSIEGFMREAYQLTGGYVDWLRDSMEKEVSSLVIDEEPLIDECAELAEFTAMFRARPAPTKKDGTETHETKELPSRLTHQFVRLACCLAVVTNSKSIDADVMRRVKKVAIDTSRGRTTDMAKHLYTVERGPYEVMSGGDYGRFVGDVANHANMGEDACRTVLRFLKTIGVAKPFRLEDSGPIKWKLTDKATELWKRVMT